MKRFLPALLAIPLSALAQNQAAAEPPLEPHPIGTLVFVALFVGFCVVFAWMVWRNKDKSKKEDSYPPPPQAAAAVPPSSHFPTSHAAKRAAWDGVYSRATRRQNHSGAVTGDGSQRGEKTKCAYFATRDFLGTISGGVIF